MSVFEEPAHVHEDVVGFIHGLYLRSAPELIPPVVARFYQAVQAKQYRGKPLEFLGTEDGGAPLTDLERGELFDSLLVVEYPSMLLNGVLFRSPKYSRASVTDNTGVMLDFLNNKGAQQTAYGRIRHIYSYKVSSQSEERPVLDIEWFTSNGSFFKGRMPKVKTDAKSDWNLKYPFEFASKIHIQNVAYWPQNAWKPCASTLVAIYARRKERAVTEE